MRPSNEKQKNSALPKLKVYEAHYLFLCSTTPANWTNPKLLLLTMLSPDLIVTHVERDKMHRCVRNHQQLEQVKASITCSRLCSNINDYSRCGMMVELFLRGCTCISKKLVRPTRDISTLLSLSLPEVALKEMF